MNWLFQKILSLLLPTTFLIIALAIVLFLVWIVSKLFNAFNARYKIIELSNSWQSLGHKLTIITSAISAAATAVAIFFLVHQNYELQKMKNFELYKTHREEFYAMLKSIPPSSHEVYNLTITDYHKFYDIIFNSNTGGSFSVSPEPFSKYYFLPKSTPLNHSRYSLEQFLIDINKLNDQLEYTRSKLHDLTEDQLATSLNKIDILTRKLIYKLPLKIETKYPLEKVPEATQIKYSPSFPLGQIQRVIDIGNEPKATSRMWAHSLSANQDLLFRFYNSILDFAQSDRPHISPADNTSLILFCQLKTYEQTKKQAKENPSLFNFIFNMLNYLAKGNCLPFNSYELCYVIASACDESLKNPSYSFSETFYAQFSPDYCVEDLACSIPCEEQLLDPRYKNILNKFKKYLSRIYVPNPHIKESLEETTTQ